MSDDVDDLATDMGPKPWWVWQIHPRAKRMTFKRSAMVVRASGLPREEGVELELPLPYARVDWRHLHYMWSAGHGLSMHVGAVSTASIEAWDLARIEFTRWFGRWFGDIGADGFIHASSMRQRPSETMGSMLAVEMLDIFGRRPTRTPGSTRSQRYSFLLTPPVVMFCDLTGTFDPKVVGPTTFWLQPQIFNATGEIMQGSPVEQSRSHARRGHAARSAPCTSPLSIHHRELQEAARGAGVLPALSGSDRTAHAARIVIVALDAYLERGEPDPRFVDPDKVYGMAELEPF